MAKLQFQELLNVLVQLHGLPLVYNREGYISLEKLLETLIINIVFSFSFLLIVTYFHSVLSSFHDFLFTIKRLTVLGGGG